MKSRGYTLVALMIGITVMMIVIAAILPLASTQTQREREEELIFRGRQYAEGIRCFKRKYGRPPSSLKEMYQTRPRTLRKLWKDPITNSTRWGLVNMGTLTPIGPAQGGLPGSTSGGSSFGSGGFGSGGFGGKGGTSPTPSPSPTPDPFTTGSDSTGGAKPPGQQGEDTAAGSNPTDPSQTAPLPVLGVYSLSHKKAMRTYQGRDTYDAWKFDERSLTDAGGGIVNVNMTPGGLPGPGIGPPGAGGVK